MLNAINHFNSLSFPSLEKVKQFLPPRAIVVQLVALTALSLLPSADAGPCDDKEEICVKACHAFHVTDNTGACLIGCKLAYWLCLALTKS